MAARALAGDPDAKVIQPRPPINVITPSHRGRNVDLTISQKKQR